MSTFKVDNLVTWDGLKSVTVANLFDALAKLGGIAVGATVNSSDAQLRDRSTHTGEQAVATITGLQGLLDAKLPATNPQVTGTIVEDVFAITDGASVVLDPSNGSIQTWALGASRSPTTANFASGQSIVLMITAGANTITWPSVTWAKVGGGGVAPTLTTTGQNVVVLWKVGSTLFGSFLGTA